MRMAINMTDGTFQQVFDINSKFHCTAAEIVSAAVFCS